jgi:hypothetical protein
MNMALPKIYDWQRTRAALKLLAEAFPGELSGWVLIGSGACWFYHASLMRANDPDFQVPEVGAEDEVVWLGEDIDFMGLPDNEAEDVFQSPIKPETHTISFRGVELDFLDEGFWMSSSSAAATSRDVHTNDFIFSVVNPALLYAEKCALLTHKARPQDKSQHGLLAEYLKYELCNDVENPSKMDRRDCMDNIQTLKFADPGFFAHDERLARCLIPAIAKLDPREFAGIQHWAKRQLPGYEESLTMAIAHD